MANPTSKVNLVVNGVTTQLDVHDANAVSLAGTNALAGDIIPNTDNSVDLGASSKNIKMLYTKGITINGTQFSPSDYVPRSGGAVLSGTMLGRTINNGQIAICGGNDVLAGATITLAGKDKQDQFAGLIYLRPNNGSNLREMYMYASGTWTWNGTACQITSDQRLKQQISEIDDKLLDAWEDVEPVQFKYNDAVDTKKDNARLHTGYVVQQIDEACKSHGVDISDYGLYCHEEYPEETEEAEVEQEDGTKTKEKKVIREASEHYSLRYTEALIVECAYLRKCIKELRNEIEQLKSSK